MAVSHLGHAEWLTPCLTDSLALFVDVMGMTESGGAGDSVLLHDWDDDEVFRLQLEMMPARPSPSGPSPAMLSRR